jgi:hypothetical protein
MGSETSARHPELLSWKPLDAIVGALIDVAEDPLELAFCAEFTALSSAQPVPSRLADCVSAVDERFHATRFALRVKF